MLRQEELWQQERDSFGPRDNRQVRGIDLNMQLNIYTTDDSESTVHAVIWR